MRPVAKTGPNCVNYMDTIIACTLHIGQYQKWGLFCTLLMSMWTELLASLQYGYVSECIQATLQKLQNTFSAVYCAAIHVYQIENTKTPSYGNLSLMANEY